MPTAALNAASATLAAMPMALVRIMAVSRSEEAIVTCDWVIVNLAFCNVRELLKAIVYQRLFRARLTHEPILMWDHLNFA